MFEPATTGHDSGSDSAPYAEPASSIPRKAAPGRCPLRWEPLRIRRFPRPRIRSTTAAGTHGFGFRPESGRTTKIRKDERMTSKILLGITGANGRMGRAFQTLLQDDARFELVAKIARNEDWHAAPSLDVVIDFSTREGFDAALAHCEAHGVALIAGTTGVDAAQHVHFAA